MTKINLNKELWIIRLDGAADGRSLIGTTAIRRKSSASKRMRRDGLSGLNGHMYYTDFITGETSFQLSTAGLVRSVILEMFINRERIRLQMQRHADKWIARIKLAPGWCVYSFEVDGKAQWDRDAGKMKAQDGRPCSLAVISTRFK